MVQFITLYSFLIRKDKSNEFRHLCICNKFQGLCASYDHSCYSIYYYKNNLINGIYLGNFINITHINYYKLGILYRTIVLHDNRLFQYTYYKRGTYVPYLTFSLYDNGLLSEFHMHNRPTYSWYDNGNIAIIRHYINDKLVVYKKWNPDGVINYTLI